jgi:hypothetical protein
MFGLSSTMQCHAFDIWQRIYVLASFQSTSALFTSRFLPHFLVGFSLFLCLKGLVCAKMFGKLGYCRTLCYFLRGQVVNCSHRSYTMLLSKLTLGVAKPLTRLEEVLPTGTVQPPTVDHPASAWFRTLSALQAKPSYLLDGSTFWVSPSPSAVGCYTSVWSYCLVRVSEDMNCYLPH